MKKNTKKTKFTPLYVVDITDCHDEMDIHEEFVFAKFDAGLPLKKSERDFIVDTIIEETANITMASIINSAIKINVDDTVYFGDNHIEVVSPKKPNIFKRFWNWITRKK